jgi:hypothetical protein
MNVHWKRLQLKTNHQEVVLCPHDEIKQPWTLSPTVVHQKKNLWKPGPPIRECCIARGKGLAIAAWWWEVEQRFNELLTVGLPDAQVTQVLRWQVDVIEQLLEETVPKPSKTQRQRYIWYREDLNLVREVPDPPGFRQLGLSWPCTKEDLEKRWRELAHTTHPDKGGSAQEFHTVSQAYRTAKSVFESRP